MIPTQQQCCDYVGDPDIFVSKPCIPSVKVFKRGPSHCLFSVCLTCSVAFYSCFNSIQNGMAKRIYLHSFNRQVPALKFRHFHQDVVRSQNDTQRILQRLGPSPHCKAAFSVTASPAVALGDTIESTLVQRNSSCSTKHNLPLPFFRFSSLYFPHL